MSAADVEHVGNWVRETMKNNHIKHPIEWSTSHPFDKNSGDTRTGGVARAHEALGNLSNRLGKETAPFWDTGAATFETRATRCLPADEVKTILTLIDPIPQLDTDPAAAKDDQLAAVSLARYIFAQFAERLHDEQRNAIAASVAQIALEPTPRHEAHEADIVAGWEKAVRSNTHRQGLKAAAVLAFPIWAPITVARGIAQAGNALGKENKTSNKAMGFLTEVINSVVGPVDQTVFDRATQVLINNAPPKNSGKKPSDKVLELARALKAKASPEQDETLRQTLEDRRPSLLVAG